MHRAIDTGRLCALAALLLLASRPAAAYDWLQFGGDPQHSGRNSAESTLTPANVGMLALAYQVTLPGSVDGAPVFLENIATPGGVKNLLFTTTTDGQIVALDAGNGAVVWSHANGPNGCTVINNGGGACYTTSSPAIDPNRQYVYSYGLDGYIHKYQVGDGTEILTGGWPELATLKGYDEKGSSALSIAAPGGVKYLYAAHAGYPGDQGDYQGHVTAINLATGAQKVFNTACSDKALHLDHFVAQETPTTCATRQNAIWARPGVFYDAGTNRIFVATGNAFTAGVGRFDGLHNWSESVLALQPDGSGGSGPNAGKPVDSYTPPNWSALDDGDADIGSTGPTILPAPANSNLQHLAVQSGKDGMLRLLNLANLSGQGGPGHTAGSISPPIALRQGGGVFSQPAVWVNPADGSSWFFVVNGKGASAVRLDVDNAGNPSIGAQSTQWPPIGAPTSVPGGTSPIVANNMLFYISGANIRAVDAATGTILLTASGTGSPHWQSLIIANGVVYATDNAAHLTAFALPPPAPPTTTALASAANPANAGTTVGLIATVTGVAPTGNVAFSEGGGALSGCTAVPLAGSGDARTATCNFAGFSVGTHAVVASYGGDAGNPGSSSSALLQVIDTAAGGSNVAAASAGGVASASSVFSSAYPVAAVNDNDRAGAAWGHGGGWNDATANQFPDWVEIDFNGSKTIDRIIVYTLEDNYSNPIEPTDTLIFTQFGVTDFNVQGWNGSMWVTLGSVSGNNLVKRAVMFAPFTTSRIRVNVTNAPVLYSRLVEVEAWGTANLTATVTTVSSSQNPILAGGIATFTATVTGSNPTGLVLFKIGGQYVNGCVFGATLVGVGNVKTASCSTGAPLNVLPPGSYGVSAAYVGDAQNSPSQDNSLLQDVGTTPAFLTSTTIASSPNPSNLGSTVTFTATVNGQNPTGVVDFRIVGCTAKPLTGNGDTKSAQCATGLLPLGDNGVVAAYSGDGNNTPSQAQLTQVVGPAIGTNFALAANGGVATASSTYSAAYPVTAVNDGDRTGAGWGAGGGWNDATANRFPDTLQISFSGSKTINRVVLYTLQDDYASPVEPTDTQTFSLYGVTAFRVQGWTGRAWTTLAVVSGNNLVKRSVSFPDFTTSRIRVGVTGALASYSRVTEIEAWGR